MEWGDERRGFDGQPDWGSKAGDPLVVSLRPRWWVRIGVWPALAVSLFGGALWVVQAPAWEVIVIGVPVAAAMVLALITAVGGLRAGRGRRRELVATETGMSTATWSLDWDHVESMKIGYTPNGSRALVITPLASKDVQLTSRAMRATRSISDRLPGLRSVSPISLLAMNVERPLDQLLEQLEGKALAARQRTR